MSLRLATKKIPVMLVDQAAELTAALLILARSCRRRSTPSGAVGRCIHQTVSDSIIT